MLPFSHRHCATSCCQTMLAMSMLAKLDSTSMLASGGVGVRGSGNIMFNVSLYHVSLHRNARQ